MRSPADADPVMSNSTRTPSTQRLEDSTVVVVGAGSGIGRRLADDLTALGATVVRTARHPRDGDQRLDLGDEASIAELAATVGPVDHVVILAAAHANGPVADLELEAVRRAFDAKVLGPLLLAKHLEIRPGGSIVLFSGVAAHRPQPGLVVMATTNGAAEHLAQALAVELAPIRVNAVSPGIVDSGAWDRLGPEKDEFLASTAAANPARRVGTTQDLSEAVVSLLANPFITGTTLHVDGGGRLA